MLVLPKVNNRTVKCEKTNKGTIECDKSMVTCDVSTIHFDVDTTQCDDSTVQCEIGTIKYDVFITCYCRLLTGRYYTPQKRGSIVELPFSWSSNNTF